MAALIAGDRGLGRRAARSVRRLYRRKSAQGCPGGRASLNKKRAGEAHHRQPAG